MQTVFWLMWLSDIAGSVSIVGQVSVVAFGVSMVVLTIAAIGDGYAGAYAKGFRVVRWLLLPVAIAGVTPNSRTIQLLAVSSAAQAAASTPLGAKSMEAIDALLDRVIAESKKK